jgi:hypothetical protein
VKSRLFLAWGVGLAAAATGQAEVEFAGYIKAGTETKFVLADAAAGKTSDWLSVGGAFGDYKITGFDPRTETLAVTRNGTAARLVLKSAQVRAGLTVGGRRLIEQYEAGVRDGSGKPLPADRWVDGTAAEIDKWRINVRNLRETAARQAPPPAIGLAEYAELFRYVLGAVREKHAALSAELPAEDWRVKKAQLLISELEKELGS